MPVDEIMSAADGRAPGRDAILHGRGLARRARRHAEV